ncbi:glycoside hydrolase family 57 protein [Sulfurivermis fontis]|uniref:glycoside hydrolase family 57 protein n=1 Tax=Sulfurivermis fontis TaxID=1972068 RepID=UPI000FDAEBD6|nr:glycoside hydrolase family 57 protein [Sulfurivermis fontis]
MSANPRLKVVLCWHMHQPQYFDLESGQYQLPWTYLHAIKDYVDMAAIIEAVPGARAVINFAPTLLEQLDDYALMVRDYLNRGAPLRDPLLAALVAPALPGDAEQRLLLIKNCLRANEIRLIDRFPQFRLLADIARCVEGAPRMVRYLDEQYLIDLLVWYHLAWMGETVRRGDSRVQQLMERGSGYTQADRRLLLQLIGELLDSVVPRYRRLAQDGRIELSVTPYAHPIMPLLLDIQSAREAMPEARLPLLEKYPGGEARVRWHVREGIRVFEQHFGSRPRGCWPSEGGVSTATVRLLAEEGFVWAASGESVLRNSLHRAAVPRSQCIHRPYQVDGAAMYCFFRDDGLSDLIGFTYANWHADDAVNNLVHHLENIAAACAEEPNRVVSIIMDGENAWEYYPENGFHFLSALYRRLATHPGLELTTFGDCVDAGLVPTPLSQLVAGSWVYGTFSTWIGEVDKNHAWDLLGDAKRAFDAAVAAGRLSGERLREAELQLGVCEGSDWFWWFGDYNPADSVRDFDRLFRMQLAKLYRLIGEEPPASITHVLFHGGGTPQMGGVMRRGQENT